MCGIAGILDLSHPTDRELENAARAMADAIRHRGPDDEGVHTEEDSGVALAQRRLAIVDISPGGHQPMTSPSGRSVVTFNGEIYNHAELRQDLEREGHVFRTRSDTEVMLVAFEAWGIVPALKRMSGMFAIALWDREEGVLHFIRDRMGKKPLYVLQRPGLVLFGSELKAILAYPKVSARIDRRVVASYFERGYVQGNDSIYADVTKVPPGHIVSVAAATGIATTPQAYWSLDEIAARGVANPLTASDDVLIERLEETLGRAVEERMLAEVPVGAFLSGGIDSTVVVALMKEHSAQPPRTFTIGFDDDEHDEAEHAKAVADHLGTQHTEFYVDAKDALAVIPKIPDHFDEPFADASQIPTLLVAQLARRHVTVALSGDGGDELFGGYTRHTTADAVARWYRLPKPFRRLAAAGFTIVPRAAWDAALRGRVGHRSAGDKLHKLAAAIQGDDVDSNYGSLLAHWPQGSSIVLGARPPVDPKTAGPTFADAATRMMYLDAAGYLPDDVLTKVDRATMSVALEARAPLLDHRVVELAWSMPRSVKIKDGTGKWILRQLAYRRVPRGLLDRPKTGFGVPIGRWLKGPLRDWAEARLDEDRLRKEGFLDFRLVRKTWEAHLAGRRNAERALWDVLMFQLWLERTGAHE